MDATPMVPNGNDSSANNVATLDELRAELSKNLDKYNTDPNYRKDWQVRLERASKGTGYVDKIGS